MKAIAIVVLALVAACAPARRPAPVEDRRPPLRAAVPQTPAVSEPAAPEGFYFVKKGDTLYSIALEHGHDYREVAQWNSLDDPTRINAGQMLRVAPRRRRSRRNLRWWWGMAFPDRIESRAIASPVLESKPAPVIRRRSPGKSRSWKPARCNSPGR